MTQESTPPLEPLPCPFCGSDPVPDFCSTNDGPVYSFHCQSKDCPAWPNVQGETEAEAIAAWNRRTPPASQHIAELEGALRGLVNLWGRIVPVAEADAAINVARAALKEKDNG